MVKTVTVLLLTLCFAAPAFAQDDDYPRIETTFAYSNIDLDLGGMLPGRHSGFSNISGLNLFPWLGIENYMGYYGLGGQDTLGASVSLFSNTFGPRLTARSIGRIVPYFGAGLGVGYFSAGGGTIGGSNFATRFGGGFDIPINDSISFKVDVGRLAVRTASVTGQGWSSGTNITTGIVLNIGQ